MNTPASMLCSLFAVATSHPFVRSLTSTTSSLVGEETLGHV